MWHIENGYVMWTKITVDGIRKIYWSVKVYYRYVTCNIQLTSIILKYSSNILVRVGIVTQTDRPKSVRNHFVIEVFGGGFVLSCCFLDFSVGVRAFVIGLGQISSFFTTRNVSNLQLSFINTRFLISSHAFGIFLFKFAKYARICYFTMCLQSHIPQKMKYWLII